MKTYQYKVSKYKDISEINISFIPDIFFLFISHTFPEKEKFIQELSIKYNNSILIGCSTSGEIFGNEVLDSTISLTAVKFEKTRIKTTEVDFESYGKKRDSFNKGSEISEKLADTDLQHIFILSDSLFGNGTKLIDGLNSRISKSVTITGGLAGNNNGLNVPFVIHNGTIKTKKIIALGLYGKDLKVSIGSRGGWDNFGIEKKVTKSIDNVLYEVDGQPALDMYKSFLGDKVKDLPSSALAFPLSMRNKVNTIPVVRSVVDINEKDRSLIFVGKIPEGSYLRGMKSNIDRLINGAEQAAIVCKNDTNEEPQLAFLISSFGRRLVMKQLVEEEVEAVNEVLGNNICTTGFYSHGEVSPFDKNSPCVVHNQTISITTFSE